MPRQWLPTVRPAQVQITREDEYPRFDDRDSGGGGMNLKVGAGNEGWAHE